MRRYLRWPGACGMGPDGGGDAAWAVAVLHRISQAGRPVRSLGGGLSADAENPNAAAKRDILGTLLLAVLAGISATRISPRCVATRSTRCCWGCIG